MDDQTARTSRVNQKMHNGVTRAGLMKGDPSAFWTNEAMADVFLRETGDFFEKRSYG